MISEEKLNEISHNCRAEKVCLLLVEYKDLAARYTTLRKIKANLIRAFDEEITRLRTVLKAAGVSTDNMLPSKWDRMRSKFDDGQE